MGKLFQIVDKQRGIVYHEIITTTNLMRFTADTPIGDELDQLDCVEAFEVCKHWLYTQKRAIEKYHSMLLDLKLNADTEYEYFITPNGFTPFARILPDEYKMQIGRVFLIDFVTMSLIPALIKYKYPIFMVDVY